MIVSPPSRRSPSGRTCAPPRWPSPATPMPGWRQGRSTRTPCIGRRIASAILSGLYGRAAPARRDPALPAGDGLEAEDASGAEPVRVLGRPDREGAERRAAATGARVLVNCASQEYFGAVAAECADAAGRHAAVSWRTRPAEPKTVSFYAKRARGAMARFIVQNRLTDPEALRDFDTGGYRLPARSVADGSPGLRAKRPQGHGRRALPDPQPALSRRQRAR